MFHWFLKSATGKPFLDWDCAWDFANLAAITASASMEEQIDRDDNSDDGTHGRRHGVVKGPQAGRAAEVMLVFYENHKSEKDVEAFIERNLDLRSIREMAVTVYQTKKF